MLYLDTSALVKLVRPEQESAALADWLNARAGEAAVTSTLTEVELPRAIRRSSPGDLAGVAAVLARLARFEIDAAVRATAAACTDPNLRSLDAIHLATADQLRASGKAVTAFVTYDGRLAQAAEAAGFPAAAPGSDARLPQRRALAVGLGAQAEDAPVFLIDPQRSRPGLPRGAYSDRVKAIPIACRSARDGPEWLYGRATA